MESPYTLIILTSSLYGLLGGYIMHRSDFCVSGMFRDLFIFKEAFMLRMLGILIIVSMVVFELAVMAGAITLHPLLE